MELNTIISQKNSRISIAIGADHRGFQHKEILKTITFVTEHQSEIIWHDVGCFTPERCDYPPIAQMACNLILEHKADLGILLCGSGVGMSIAANRFRGIYAGVAWNTDVARAAREDDHINVLVIPTDYVSLSDAPIILEAWLSAQPKGQPYSNRLSMIDR